LKPRGVYVLVGGPMSRIFAALLLGPLISLAGNRKMGLQMGWKPFKQQDVAILRELIEAVGPGVGRALAADRRQATPAAGRTCSCDVSVSQDR
jgi:hypothetical protein